MLLQGAQYNTSLHPLDAVEDDGSPQEPLAQYQALSSGVR